MVETPPTAANMRFDGGHAALELVNTVYGQVGGPVEHDVLATPGDLVTLTRRLGLAAPDTPASPEALAAALRLRAALDAVLRAHVAGLPAAPEALATIAEHARAAVAAATLAPREHALAWTWAPEDPHTPVHRLADAAVGLLGSEEEMGALHCCQACCWLFLDRSRNGSRRWCSMADCGTEAKKRRYVQRRRERRTRGG